jgi:hypothetical protein
VHALLRKVEPAVSLSPADSNDPVSVGQARVLRATTKALLVEVDGEQTWVPKSCIHDDSEVWRDDSEPGELVVKAWFARKEGWE